MDLTQTTRPVLHPLVEELLADERLDAFAQELPAAARVSEPVLPLLLAALHERLARLEDNLAIADIKKILASQDDPDYPVSRGGGRNLEDAQIGFTLACCIFELSAEPRLHIASGPPHANEFRTFSP